MEGFGYRWDSKDNYPYQDAAHLTGVVSGGKSNACFKPLPGLFSQSKFIPLTWCPIALEFETVSGATDSVIVPTAGGTFTPSSTSTSWQTQDVRGVADAVTLDNGLQNSYAEHVLSGKSQPINYSTYIRILQKLRLSSYECKRYARRLKTKDCLFQFWWWPLKRYKCSYWGL